MTRIMKECKPSPGSRDAVEIGCGCPIMDNRYGWGYMAENEFVINMACPIHTVEVEDLQEMVGIENERD